MIENNRSDNETLGPKIKKTIGIGAGIAALAGGITLATNEKGQEAVMVEVDPEAAEAARVKELLAKIGEATVALKKLEGNANVSKEDLIMNPGDVIETMQTASRSVKKINLALEEIKGMGFKVNSVIAYEIVRYNEDILAKLSSGGLISDVLEKGKYVANIEIPGTTITLSPEQSSRALTEKKQLVKDLKRMNTLLGEISEPNMDGYSNNNYVNEEVVFEPPKHRLEFLHAYMTEVLRKDIERKEGGKKYIAGVEGFVFYRAFLEQYGFTTKYPDGVWDLESADRNGVEVDMNRVKRLDKQGKESYKAMMRVALKAMTTYEKTEKVTTSPQIGKLQDKLARWGYFDFSHFDTSYGEETHTAFTAYLEDNTYSDIDELVGLQ